MRNHFDFVAILIIFAVFLNHPFSQKIRYFAIMSCVKRNNPRENHATFKSLHWLWLQNQSWLKQLRFELGCQKIVLQKSAKSLDSNTFFFGFAISESLLSWQQTYRSAFLPLSYSMAKKFFSKLAHSVWKSPKNVPFEYSLFTSKNYHKY